MPGPGYLGRWRSPGAIARSVRLQADRGLALRTALQVEQATTPDYRAMFREVEQRLGRPGARPRQQAVPPRFEPPAIPSAISEIPTPLGPGFRQGRGQRGNIWEQAARLTPLTPGLGGLPTPRFLEEVQRQREATRPLTALELGQAAITPMAPQLGELAGRIPVVGPEARLAANFLTSPLGIASAGIAPGLTAAGLGGQAILGTAGGLAEQAGAPVAERPFGLPFDIGPRGVGEVVGGFAGPGTFTRPGRALVGRGAQAVEEAAPVVRRAVQSELGGVAVENAPRRAALFKESRDLELRAQELTRERLGWGKSLDEGARSDPEIKGLVDRAEQIRNEIADLSTERGGGRIAGTDWNDPARRGKILSVTADGRVEMPRPIETSAAQESHMDLTIRLFGNSEAALRAYETGDAFFLTADYDAPGRLLVQGLPQRLTPLARKRIVDAARQGSQDSVRLWPPMTKFDDSIVQSLDEFSSRPFPSALREAPERGGIRIRKPAPEGALPSEGGAVEPPEPPAAGVPDGGVPDTAVRELLGGQAVAPQLGRRDRALNLLKRTVGIGVEEEATGSSLMRQRRDLKHTVDALANRLGAGGGAQVRRAFQVDDLGRIQSLPGAPTIQDVAARLPQYEGSLTPEQRSVMQWLRGEVAPYEAALREQGVEFGSRTDVVEGGFYLPRGRADLEGADMPVKFGAGGGKTGGKKGFERGAVFDSMAEGIDAGYRYAPFDETLRSYANDAGGRALDSYTANLFKTATDDAGRLLGETPHARLLRQNPEIAQRVEGLRKAVASLRRNVGTLSRHHEEVLTRFGASPGPDLEELQIALRELRQSPMRSVKGQTLAEARASLNDAQQQVKAVMPDWKKALERSRQSPRNASQIGFYQLQGTSYPDAVANAANKYLRAEAPPSGAGAGLLTATGALNNLLRGVRATADVSFTGIQGLLGLAHKPASYSRAMKVAVKSMGDRDALGSFIMEFDRRAAAEGGLSSREWLKAGLRVGGTDTEFMIGQGLGSVGQRIGQLPVVKQANRAFGYFGDTLRLDAAQGMLRASGAKDAAAIADMANLMTGWSKGRFLGDVGNLVQFAPRFFQSQLDLLARAATNTGPAGTQARLALVKLIGAGTLITVAANEALGNKGFDYLTPMQRGRLNPNFMRIRFKGTDYSVFGPWDSLLRGVVSAAKGDVGYLARSKSSPVVGMAWDAITGRTFTGERFGPESLLRGLLPFSFADIGEEGAIQTGISTTGIKATPMTGYEQLSAKFRELHGRPFNGTPEDWLLVRRTPELQALSEQAQQAALSKGSVSAERGQTIEQARIQTEQELGLPELARQFRAGAANGPAIISRWEDLGSQMAGSYRVVYIGSDPKKAETKDGQALQQLGGLNPNLAPWTDFQTGEVDWDGFYAKREELLASLSPEVKKAYDTFVAKSVDPDLRAVEPQIRKAKDLRRELYDTISPYEGLSVESAKGVKDFQAAVAEARTRLAVAGVNTDKIDSQELYQVVAKQQGKPSGVATVAWMLRPGSTSAQKFQNLKWYEFLLDHQDELVPFFPDLYKRRELQKALKPNLFQVVASR